MATWLPDSLRTKGAKATFHEVMDTIPTFWQEHCQQETSDTNVETYAFPGALPIPRLFLNSRQFQGMKDFSFTLTNNKYELSTIINRDHWEDDQTGLIKQRMTELGEAWATLKDSLFSTLLAAGNSSGSNGFDGTTFYSADHSAGTLGAANDNLSTSTAAGGTVATAAEWIARVAVARAEMIAFNDDQGRPFNHVAVGKMRVIVHATQTSALFAAMNATMVGTSGGQTTVGIQNFLDGFDMNPYQASGDSDDVYFTAVGASRKPFIYQSRVPLEIVIMDGVNDVALNEGVKVLTRERFVFGYGDHRRSIRHTWS